MPFSSITKSAANDRFKAESIVDTSEIPNSDDWAIEQQGKKRQLKRCFGFWSMLGFAVVNLSTWSAILYVNSYALVNGGPVGLLYGFIFCFAGSMATCASLAELVSMAPTSGGQYHWVAILAPPQYRNFLSWITGWLSVLGWQAFCASCFYLTATFTQAIVVLNHPTYVPTSWRSTLLFYGFLAVSLLFITFTPKLLPKAELVALAIYLLGYVALLVPLIYLSPTKNSPSFVFTDFESLNGWKSDGAAWLIGLLSGIFPFMGYDGPCHMVEEVRNATIVVPWCMVSGVLINGLL
ncbi:MAG: hypothetical protein Q9164_007354, partial [Protoblastenia rupestris]